MINKPVIPASESITVEFKISFNEDVIETLVAFSNTKGGTVYIGVAYNGKIKGLQIGKETIQNWINEVKTKTLPAIIPDTEILTIENKTVVAIRVTEYPIKPVSTRGRYYKRIGNSNHLMSTLEITNLNIQSLQTSWDAFPALNMTINDLDISKINNFIEKVNSKGRYQLQDNWKNNLEKLRLIKGKTITNAAWLLFGKEATGYNIHIGRFKTPSLIIDDKMLNGTLFEMVAESMNYIIGQIKVAFEITGIPTSRTEIFEYPLPALRELVLNALIHRDYLSPVDAQIKIFDNEITFFNPGNLYGDLTIEDLKKDNYQAYARNKLIAEAFYLTGDIEKYGTGFIRIRKEIKSYPTMLFDFEEIPNGFLTKLNYKTQKTSTKNERVNERVNEINEREQTLIQLINKYPKITQQQLS